MHACMDPSKLRPINPHTDKTNYTNLLPDRDPARVAVLHDAVVLHVREEEVAVVFFLFFSHVY